MVVSTTSKFWSIFYMSVLLLLFPHTLFSAGSSEELPVPEIPQQEIPVEVQVITEMQDRYDSIGEDIPAMVMLDSTGTSIIPIDFLLRIDTELPRLLVNQGKVKPISMEGYFTEKYSEKKATSSFALMNALNAELYPVPLEYICKPYIFQADDYYVITVTFYSLSAQTSYPITVLRLFESYDDISSVLTACLEEMEYRLFEKSRGTGQKRIIVEDFSLSFLQIVELETGEFEFISAPFIKNYGISLRDSDDYFSLIMGYVLSATDMFQVMRLSDFSEFADTGDVTLSKADYSVQGKVQLSEKLNVLYVDVKNLQNNTVLVSIRYPLRDCTLKNIWNAYRDISSYLVNVIMEEDIFGYVPSLEAEGRAFYANDMFIGWDSLEGQIFQKGLNEIYTGSYYRQGSKKFRYEKEIISDLEKKFEEEKSEDNLEDTVAVTMAEILAEIIIETVADPVGVYYVLLDTIDQMFTDREGEFLWNLLKKEEDR